MNSEKKISELVSQVGLNATASAELLLIAAGYFEAGKPLPQSLAELFAKAIQKAVAEPSSERGKVLALELGLEAPGKIGAPRKDVDEQAIHEFIAAEIIKAPEQFSETKLKTIVAERFGISETKALEFVKPAVFLPKLLRSNGLKGTVRTR